MKISCINEKAVDQPQPNLVLRKGDRATLSVKYLTYIFIMLEIFRCSMCAAQATRPQMKLSAATSDPEASTFTQGEKVELAFTVTGAEAKNTDLSLKVDICDEHDRVIESQSKSVRADDEGVWKVQLNAPSDLLGFYRVRAELSNGVKLAPAGSRAEGFITYAVLPDPALRKDYGAEKSRFGMQGSFGPWNSRIKRDMGIRWVLADDPFFGWRNQEPQKAGQFDPDVLVAKEQKRTPPAWRTYPVPTLMSAPKWAVKPGTLNGYTGVLTEEGEKAWAAYCQKAAYAFAKLYPDMPHVYQITWEPFKPWDFKGADRALVRIYELAYPALHAGDPKAIVAGPGGMHMDKDEVAGTTALLEKGLATCLDGYTVHPYSTFAPESDGLIDSTRAMKAVLRQYIGRDAPQYGTEQSNRTEEDPRQDLGQARTLVRQNLIMLGEGYRFNFGFYITDYRWGDERGFGYYYNLDAGSPFGPKKISPKPVVPAYAAQSLLLDGCDSLGAIEWLGETTCGYTFVRGDEVVLALWDYGDQARTVVLPVGSEEVTICDWMGNARKVKSSGGQLELALGIEPIYVKGISSSLWGPAARMRLQLDAQQPPACPGDDLIIRGKVAAGSSNLDSVTVVAMPSSNLSKTPLTQTLKPSKSADTAFQFAVHVPADAVPGRYPVRVMLQDSNGYLAAGGLAAQVVAPVTVTSIRPHAQANGGRGVMLQLQNQLPEASAGKVAVTVKDVPAVEGHSEFVLPPGGAQQVPIGLAGGVLDPLQRYLVQTTLTSAKGLSYTQTQKLDFLTATRLSHAPELKDNLDDWAGVPEAKLAGRQAVIRGEQYYSGDADLSASLRLGWDEKALYLRAEVVDDVFYQPHTDSSTWLADCLQVGISLDPYRQMKDTGNVAADRAARQRFSEINVALTPKGPQLWRSSSFDPEKAPTGLIQPGKGTAAIVGRDGKTIYEIAIPWATLAAQEAPSAGDALGFAITVNDSDGPEQHQPAALGAFGGIHPAKDANQFGLLLLVANP